MTLRVFGFILGVFGVLQQVTAQAGDFTESYQNLFPFHSWMFVSLRLLDPKERGYLLHAIRLFLRSYERPALDCAGSGFRTVRVTVSDDYIRQLTLAIYNVHPSLWTREQTAVYDSIDDLFASDSSDGES